MTDDEIMAVARNCTTPGDTPIYDEAGNVAATIYSQLGCIVRPNGELVWSR